ncbi:S41 family peptidase [Flavobacterium lipolyticum]|uniref:Tail specific protease domain-containing protein n=1 Tax=Flavobacterium lipolyticum TaxID=2893754 RepID=A0ABS8LYW6_9FLAO|nr:S41 family peptidase [Flavobacterium sp. F-126]MCC9017735.1 hypothetical protein [Flavobacterium sp. F-126]
MKRKVLVFVFLVFGVLSFGNGKGISSNENQRIENLSSLAKIWGFLKYYHPNVARGNFNWDEQLIMMIPKVEGAKNREDLSKIYLDWITSLGVVKECRSCQNISGKSYFDKNFDLSWMDNLAVFTPELSRKLRYIEENRAQSNSFYVTKSPRENVEVRNESKYKDFEYPEKNYRLLSLFKYWNTIEYFFPYKYLTDQKWSTVLEEMIPRFEKVNNATEYQLVLLETVIKIDDTHASLYTNKNFEFFGKKYIPAFSNVIENKVVIVGIYNDSLARINDIRKGDIIEEIDGVNALEIMADRKKYVNGSNSNTKAKNYNYQLFNGSTDSVKVKIRRDNDFVLKTVKRYKGSDLKSNLSRTKEKFNLDANNIGYINLANIEANDQEEIMDKLKSTKALIIDLRNYPPLMPYRIARRLSFESKEYVKCLAPDLKYPGRFFWKKSLVIEPLKKSYYRGKVVLLVNEETQSRAEFVTMLLQAGDNVTTIGSQTAAADGDVSRFEFSGFVTAISGLGVFYPDGTETQRKGVKIDIEVRPTVKGIQEGKDEVLEKAKEYLVTEKS